MKRPPGLPRHTTTLGHVPAVIALLFAFTLGSSAYFEANPAVFGGLSFSGAYLAIWSLGVLVVAYVVWLVLVLRRVVTAATGGGLALAAYALCLRALAACGEAVLPWYGRTWLPERPVFDVLDAAYGLATVTYVYGLASVVAACIAERMLRRDAPDWALPE